MRPPASHDPAASPPRRSGTKKPTAKGKKVAKSLVALSSAAIVSVYGVGYARTNAAIPADAPPALSVASAVVPTFAGGTLVPAIAPPTPAATAATASAFPAPPTLALPTVTPTGPSAVPSLPASGVAPSATRSLAATATVAPAATATTAQLMPTATAPPPATAPPAAPAAPAVSAAPATGSGTVARYKDGTYTGTGSSRHGSITATVVIQGGAITSAAVTQCGTRYPCSKIAALPGEVVAGQSSVVDAISGATDSSVAYQGAVANALAKAMAG